MLEEEDSRRIDLRPLFLRLHNIVGPGIALTVVDEARLLAGTWHVPRW